MEKLTEAQYQYMARMIAAGYTEKQAKAKMVKEQAAKEAQQRKFAERMAAQRNKSIK